MFSKLKSQKSQLWIYNKYILYKLNEAFIIREPLLCPEQKHLLSTWLKRKRIGLDQYLILLSWPPYCKIYYALMLLCRSSQHRVGGQERYFCASYYTLYFPNPAYMHLKICAPAHISGNLCTSSFTMDLKLSPFFSHEDSKNGLSDLLFT